MFTLYASENFDSFIDTFLPNNYTETQSIINTLTDLVKYDKDIKEPLKLITLLIDISVSNI